jgi:hypothetical protein
MIENQWQQAVALSANAVNNNNNQGGGTMSMPNQSVNHSYIGGGQGSHAGSNSQLFVGNQNPNNPYPKRGVRKNVSQKNP